MYGTIKCQNIHEENNLTSTLNAKNKNKKLKFFCCTLEIENEFYNACFCQNNISHLNPF